jgi:hypothetical protein
VPQRVSQGRWSAEGDRVQIVSTVSTVCIYKHSKCNILPSPRLFASCHRNA